MTQLKEGIVLVKRLFRFLNDHNVHTQIFNFNT